jgi:hypothetical protein
LALARHFGDPARRAASANLPKPKPSKGQNKKKVQKVIQRLHFTIYLLAQVGKSNKFGTQEKRVCTLL